MNKLLIIADNAEEYVHHLRQRSLPQLDIAVATSSEQAKPLIAEANVILAKPAMVTPILHQATRLQWLQSAFAGIEPFCAPELRQDYCLTGVKEIFGPLMSEYVFTYLLGLERNIFATRANQLRQSWQPLPYRSLNGLTLGICGLGSIGQHIAKTAQHFGLEVLGLSRSGASVPAVQKVYRPDEILTLAKAVDYLVMVLPLTQETRGLVNREVLQALGSKGTLINVGRGAVVDETALTEALSHQQIRGAVLDVFEAEPLAAESPLWSFENVVITPHNSAVTFPEDIARIFADNYQRFMADDPLKYQIDFERGY